MQALQQKAQAADKAREETQQQQQATQQADEAAARRTANCERAKANIDALQSDKVVMRVDEKGNKTRLEGQQREEALNQARKDVDYFCTP
jgi:hypothetical protein